MEVVGAGMSGRPLDMARLDDKCRGCGHLRSAHAYYAEGAPATLGHCCVCTCPAFGEGEVEAAYHRKMTGPNERIRLLMAASIGAHADYLLHEERAPGSSASVDAWHRYVDAYAALESEIASKLAAIGIK